MGVSYRQKNTVMTISYGELGNVTYACVSRQQAARSCIPLLTSKSPLICTDPFPLQFDFSIDPLWSQQEPVGGHDAVAKAFFSFSFSFSAHEQLDRLPKELRAGKGY